MAPKTKATNGAGAKAQPEKPEKPTAPPPTDGTSTPVTEAVIVSGSLGKPDKAAYDNEQDSLRKKIDELQAKSNAVKEKISNGGRDDASTARQKELKAQLDELRGHQATNKTSRSKQLDQLKAINEGVAKKIKDLNAAKGKITFKTSAEIDTRIQQLDKQIESGSMKISDEKRALAEITTLRRSRRTVESFQKEQESIEADRAKADAIRAELDDPEAKAISERYDSIKTELDSLRSAADEAYSNRNQLYDERNGYQAELDTLFSRKRELTQSYREAQDKYWAKVQEDRARRAEKARAERVQEEVEKKKALVERLREEASVPAFQAQIEDCQTLIDFFSGKTSAPAVAAALAPKQEIAGVQKLEARTVEAPGEGLIARKKKGEDEEEYFTGKAKKGGKGKKGGKPAAASTPDAEPTATTEKGDKLPLGLLSALLTMSIPPPANKADTPRVVEDLNTKKAWFVANQQRITAENVAKAEKEIARIVGKLPNGTVQADGDAPASGEVTVASTDDITPVNGGGEKPAEPAPTPAISDLKSVPAPSDAVADKLEEVVEAEAEAEA